MDRERDELEKVEVLFDLKEQLWWAKD